MCALGVFVCVLFLSAVCLSFLCVVSECVSLCFTCYCSVCVHLCFVCVNGMCVGLGVLRVLAFFLYENQCSLPGCVQKEVVNHIAGLIHTEAPGAAKQTAIHTG